MRKLVTFQDSVCVKRGLVTREGGGLDDDEVGQSLSGLGGENKKTEGRKANMHTMIIAI